MVLYTGKKAKKNAADKIATSEIRIMYIMSNIVRVAKAALLESAFNPLTHKIVALGSKSNKRLHQYSRRGDVYSFPENTKGGVRPTSVSISVNS